MSVMNFRTGEHVLHPQHGVGRIESINRRSFCGHAPASYVQLYFERDELLMTLLEDDLPGTVRGLISSEEARQLLAQISTWKGKPATQWKTRANAHQAAIDSGDPFEYFKVLKGLAHLENGGSLRLCDREHLNKSLNLLIEEFACALKKSPRQARKLINQAVGAAL